MVINLVTHKHNKAMITEFVQLLLYYYIYHNVYIHVWIYKVHAEFTLCMHNNS